MLVKQHIICNTCGIGERKKPSPHLTRKMRGWFSPKDTACLKDVMFGQVNYSWSEVNKVKNDLVVVICKTTE